MKKIAVYIIQCFAFFLFVQCSKNNTTPAPTPPPLNTTIQTLKSGNIANSFALVNNNTDTYQTQFAAEKVSTQNGHEIYVLIIEDNATTFSAQFWFDARPAAGSYRVQDIRGSLNPGLSSDQVGIAVSLPSINYYSIADGTLGVGVNQDTLTIIANNIVLTDATGNNIKEFSCSVIVP